MIRGPRALRDRPVQGSYPLALANAIRFATQIKPRGTVEDMANPDSPHYDERLFDFYIEAAERTTKYLDDQGFTNDDALVALLHLQERIQAQITQFQAVGYTDDSSMIMILKEFLP